MIPEPYLSAALGTSFTFAMTALGSAFVFLFKNKPSSLWTKLSLGFAAGIMIAASFFSLLLPAIEAEGTLPAWLTVTVGFFLGGAFIVASDLLLSRTQHNFRAIGDKRTALLYFAVTLHNVPEGMAVGVAFAAGGLFRPCRVRIWEYKSYWGAGRKRAKKNEVSEVFDAERVPLFVLVTRRATETRR